MIDTISNNLEYPKVCKQAAENDQVFNIFKSLPRYRDVLEHVTYEEGYVYYEIFKNDIDIMTNLKNFHINDKFGQPICYQYPIGVFSPTTLRYIKILQDLKNIYPIQNMNIIEIGAGYGGQYTILRQMFKPKKYTFVDLPDTINLIKKYISKCSTAQDITPVLNLVDNTIYVDGTQANQYDDSYDLIISNYAFSECDTTIQNYYLENILYHCNHGYMTCNNLKGYDSKMITKFLKTNNIEAMLYKEIPQTCPTNSLIRW